MEVNEEVIMLDSGSEEPSLVGPESYCCFIAYGPFRF
jgi:hypothetical protein